VDEHVFAAVFTLNEAEALLAVEELDDALAGANDLGRHAAAARAAEAAATAAIAATEAAAITAAKATAIAAAEAAAIATAEATAVTTAEATAIVAAAKTAATAVGIETAVVAETVALVASATTPPSVKTHKTQLTLQSAPNFPAPLAGRGDQRHDKDNVPGFRAGLSIARKTITKKGDARTESTGIRDSIAKYRLQPQFVT
jgi:hypothetical protein